MSTFRHVMFLSFTDEATSEQIDAALAGLATMPEKIPEILRYEFGLDAGAMEDNPDLALVADFASEEDWRTYLEHPEHVALSRTLIAPIKGSLTRVQYLT